MKQFKYSVFSLILLTASFMYGEQLKQPNNTACEAKEAFSETEHEIMIGNNLIAYKATVGSLILKKECKEKANIFFTSYTKKGTDLGTRPITFCFNGGPGSSSVWLHLGFVGPKKVFFDENIEALPPYKLVDNSSSLLDITDLVFIDPVSTGYSRAIPQKDAKDFHGVESDIASIGEFIRLYLSRFNRWESPKFLMGESYGTTRAAGLAGYLHDQEFIYINGLVLISSVLNFQSVDFKSNNDLPYLLFLPTYTATAYHHKKLEEGLQKNFEETLRQAKNFVITDYSQALFKGDLLSSEEKHKIIKDLSKFTGISADYIDKSNLRVDIFSFTKELLRNDKETIGIFDSCMKGKDKLAIGSSIEYDPSFSLVGAFTATLNHYLQNDLKWITDEHYKVMTNVFPWDYGCSNSYLDVSETLRSTMTKNTSIEVFVGSGYFDLATPFFGTEYTFHHLGLDSSLKDHITIKNYQGGHMMYLYPQTLIELKKDLVNYYQKTLSKSKK